MSLWILIFALLVNDRTQQECAFLPPNSLSYPVADMSDKSDKEDRRSSGLERAQFDEAITRFRDVYTPIFAQRGTVLNIQSEWERPEVNAKATFDEQDRAVIQVFGGMARHPAINVDGFLLILCHEAGHFLGGAPKAFRGNTQRRSWSSVEGQADYFATTKCLRGLFAEEGANRAALLARTPAELERLRPACSTAQCMRIVLAGESAARVFASVAGGSVRLDPEAADPSRVVQTVPGHPSAQCRLDTFISGAGCRVPWTVGFSDSDPEMGACVIPSSAQPPTPELIRNEGARPTCWFAEEAR